MRKTRKSILELDNIQARKNFLKSESYFNLEIPPYFSFDQMLKDIQINENEIKKKFKTACDTENVNYKLLTNKDGRYSWRPMQLINPLIYLILVNKITEKDNWEFIKNKFTDFSKNGFILCKSIPVISTSKNKDKAEQIFEWIEEIEQESIKLSLEYEFMCETDLSDCYGSIYTHSIPWALHGIKTAKRNRKPSELLGNFIDKSIQAMQYGQTNGIPQGSVLMDFIAEMVLGYIDLELSKRINDNNISDFKILRYRDDYRIFVNNPQVAEKIMKLLTEVITPIGLKINSSKTKISNQIIKNSFKEGKFYWIVNEISQKNLIKHLLVIYNHSLLFPNSGSLLYLLDNFYKKIRNIKKINNDIQVMISILVDIAFTSPKVYPIFAAIISKLLTFLEKKEEKLSIIEKLQNKFKKIPNIGHMELWLQRITLPIDEKKEYDESLCKLLTSSKIELWNNSWNNYKIDTIKIINKEKLSEIKNKPFISRDEFEIFSYLRY